MLSQQPFKVPCIRNKGEIEKRVFIVRHAHSLSNQDPKLLTVCSDHTIPLSDVGLKQASGCSEFLINHLKEDPDFEKRKFLVIISPYKRTRQTADFIVHQLLQAGANFITKESIYLSEQQFGLFEGLPLSILSEKYPYEYSHFEKGFYCKI